MTVFGEVKAAHALIAWLDAKKIDFPWLFARDPGGRLFFRLPVDEPYSAVVLLIRKSFVLVMDDYRPDPVVHQVVLGRWGFDSGEVFRRLLNGLYDGAMQFLGRGDFERANAFAVCAAHCAKEVGDYPLMVTAVTQVVTPYLRHGREALGAMDLLRGLHTDYAQFLPVEVRAMLEEDIRLTEIALNNGWD